MKNSIRLEADFVRSQIDALLCAYPDLEDDIGFLADVLEAETDLHRVLEKLLGERREAETMASAIKEREGDMQERRKRFERKSAGVKKIILQLMEAAQQEKITLPEATLSITKPRVSVDVTDIDALPQGFFKTERKALTAEIKTALESGSEVPGAQLVMGDVGLTVRVK